MFNKEVEKIIGAEYTSTNDCIIFTKITNDIVFFFSFLKKCYPDYIIYEEHDTHKEVVLMIKVQISENKEPFIYLSNPYLQRLLRKKKLEWILKN